jgi:hypothetical protein
VKELSMFKGENNETKWNKIKLHLENFLSNELSIGELPELEFKSTMFTPMDEKRLENAKSKGTEKQYREEQKSNIPFECSKAIMGFLNKRGGDLIVGIQEIPERKLLGIEADKNSFSNSKDLGNDWRTKSCDWMYKFINKDIMEKYVTLKIKEYGKLHLGWFHIRHSKEPVFCEKNKHNEFGGQIYSRRNKIATEALTPQQTLEKYGKK